MVLSQTQSIFIPGFDGKYCHCDNRRIESGLSNTTWGLSFKSCVSCADVARGEWFSTPFLGRHFKKSLVSAIQHFSFNTTNATSLSPLGKSMDLLVDRIPWKRIRVRFGVTNLNCHIWSPSKPLRTIKLEFTANRQTMIHPRRLRWFLYI